LLDTPTARAHRRSVADFLGGAHLGRGSLF
jgi:hypothetical protein